MPETEPLDTEDLVLLVLWKAAGRDGFSGVTRLEKLLFLLSKEGRFDGVVQQPQFEAYKYGPFSREVYDAAEFLRSVGLLRAGDQSAGVEDVVESSDRVELRDLDPDVAREFEPKSFVLTETGKKVAEKLFARVTEIGRRSIERVIAQYGHMPLTQLIRYVYSQYPEYTTKSLIRKQVLGK